MSRFKPQQIIKILKEFEEGKTATEINMNMELVKLRFTIGVSFLEA